MQYANADLASVLCLCMLQCEKALYANYTAQNRPWQPEMVLQACVICFNFSGATLNALYAWGKICMRLSRVVAWYKKQSGGVSGNCADLVIDVRTYRQEHCEKQMRTISLLHKDESTRL